MATVCQMQVQLTLVLPVGLGLLALCRVLHDGKSVAGLGLQGQEEQRMYSHALVICRSGGRPRHHCSEAHSGRNLKNRGDMGFNPVPVGETVKTPRDSSSFGGFAVGGICGLGVPQSHATGLSGEQVMSPPRETAPSTPSITAALTIRVGATIIARPAMKSGRAPTTVGPPNQVD